MQSICPKIIINFIDNYILDNSGNKQQNFVTPSLGSFTYTPSKRLDNYIGLPYGLTRQMVAVQNASGASNWSNESEQMANFSNLSSNVSAPYYVTAPGQDLESFVPKSISLNGNFGKKFRIIDFC